MGVIMTTCIESSENQSWKVKASGSYSQNGQLKTLNYITLVQSIEIFVSSANSVQLMSQLTLCREFFFCWDQ